MSGMKNFKLNSTSTVLGDDDHDDDDARENVIDLTVAPQKAQHL